MELAQASQSSCKVELPNSNLPNSLTQTQARQAAARDTRRLRPVALAGCGPWHLEAVARHTGSCTGTEWAVKTLEAVSSRSSDEAARRIERPLDRITHHTHRHDINAAYRLARCIRKRLRHAMGVAAACRASDLAAPAPPVVPLVQHGAGSTGGEAGVATLLAAVSAAAVAAEPLLLRRLRAFQRSDAAVTSESLARAAPSVAPLSLDGFSLLRPLGKGALWSDLECQRWPLV